MKLYKLFLVSMLFLVSVGGVCATDTDNITDFDNNCLSDVNCSNTLTNNLNSNDDVIDNEDNDIDCCGAIAFQSVLKENGINITLEESNKAIHSVNGSTSMQGLIDGAKAYNLTAIPLKFNNSNLKTGFIVHMNIDGKGHWIPIENFTNHILVISNDSNLNINNFNPINLNNLECKNLAGYKGKVIRGKFKAGLVYVNGRWHMGGYRVLIN